MRLAFLKEIPSALFMYILIEFPVLLQPAANHSRLGNCTAYTSKMVENFPARDENEAQLPEVIIQCIRARALDGVKRCTYVYMPFLSQYMRMSQNLFVLYFFNLL